MTFEQYCESNNIRIKVVYTLTNKERGFCYYDNEEFHVFINGYLCHYQQQKTTIHEIIHIIENHFYCPSHCIDDCETEVNTIIDKMKSYMFELSTDFI